MKKTLSLLILTLLAAPFIPSALAGGDKVRGDKGKGAVNQVQVAFLSLSSYSPFKVYMFALIAFAGVILFILGLKKSNKLLSITGVVISGVCMAFLIFMFLVTRV